MNDYATDEEQIDAMKQWWQENGKFVMGGIALGIAGLVGWSQYSEGQREAAMAASGHYDELLTALDSSRLADAEQVAGTLRDSHGDSAYAGQAELLLANFHVERGDYEPAIDALQRIVGAPGRENLQPIARLRLASLFLHLDRVDEARELIQNLASPAIRGRADELLGDIEVAAGNTQAARDAYESARTAGVDNPEFLTLKLDALPAVVEATEGDEG